MSAPAQNNQEWNIKSCMAVCASTGAPFQDGQLIISRLTLAADGTYERSDFCEAGWTDTTRQGAVSHWRSVYRAPPTKPEDPLKKGTVETLLRQFMAREDYSKLKVVYILAVMLERKRILAEKDVQRREDGSRVRVYEHKKTGEVFMIPDPELKLTELEDVTAEVNALLGIPPRRGSTPATTPASPPASPQDTNTPGT